MEDFSFDGLLVGQGPARVSTKLSELPQLTLAGANRPSRID